MGKAIIKALGVLIGILAISTALQYMIYAQGAEYLISMAGSQSSEAYPGQSEELTTEYVRNLMGLDRPFIPDLWPFDNVSFWHETEEKEQE